MMEQDISKFNPQNFVETQSKKIAQSDRLHALFKFIKFNYILPGYELKTTTKDFYEDYLRYCSLTNSTQTITKNKAISLLREHDIQYKCSNGKMYYTFTNEELRNIGNKFKWFFDNDNEDIDDNTIIKLGNSVKCLMTPQEIKLTNEIERLNKIIADLQNKQDDESVEDLDSEKTIDGPLLLFTTALTPVPAVVEEMKVIDDAFTNALNKVNTKQKKKN